MTRVVEGGAHSVKASTRVHVLIHLLGGDRCSARLELVHLGLVLL